MVFRKQSRQPAAEAATPVVDWRDVTRFSVTNVVRGTGRRAVTGAWAVRDGAGRPCAFFASGRYAPGPQRLFEDERASRPLLLVEPRQVVDGEHHYRVTDASGDVVGTVRRIPPSRRPLKHTWRIDQPGRPEIVGRNAWAASDARSLVSRTGDEVASMVFDSLLHSDEVEPGKRPPRTLLWKAGDEEVMTSGRDQPLRIKAEWLDRRLAFAFAVLGDR